MWACMQTESQPTDVTALPCNECKLRARFLTPFGLKCPDHALQAAIYHQPQNEESWIPIRIRPPSRS